MTKHLFGRIVIGGILLAALVGLLATNLMVINSLPAQIYTSKQQDYLEYNSRRSVSQKAPVLNIVQQGGQVATAVLPGQDSRVRATLTARYEELAGVSVTVYDLDFRGEYDLAAAGPEAATIELVFPFPGNLETLHDVKFLVDDEEPLGVNYTTGGITWRTTLIPGQKHRLVISYKADGANSFTYALPPNQRANVDIVVTVAGLQGSQSPRAALRPTVSESTADGETFTWRYNGLIADRNIELTLPVRLSFAQRVAQLQNDFMALAVLAPFLVGLFLAALWGMFRLGGVPLRAESYFLTGCGLALFYPLLTFLSGLVHPVLAAILALLLVGGLLLVFLGGAVGWRHSGWRVGLLLAIFLGIFSLGMLTPWRGLLLTFGGLLLVAIFMLLYARRPGLPSSPPPIIPPTNPQPEPTKSAPTPAPAKPASTAPHCPHCGRQLAADHHFCPGCGHDASQLRRCAKCKHEQFVPTDLKPAHCVNCGSVLQ